MGKFIDLTGKKFGELVIIKKDPKEYRTPSGSKYIQWICKCNCGNIISLRGNYLSSGQTTRCQKCHYKSRQLNGYISYIKIQRIKSCAKKRNIYIDKSIINKKYLWDLYLKQNKKCSLSEMDIKFADCGKKELYEKGTTASLDRINPDLPYIKNNIQWTHKDINNIKYTCSNENFIKICKMITSRNSKDLFFLQNIEEEISNFVIWYDINRDAKKRNIYFSSKVTKEFLYKLYLKQNKKCLLTGQNIYLAKNKKERPINTASLDRIDSTKGYTQNNVQWVDKQINRMKWAYPQDYFIELCEKVAEYNRN